MVAVGALGSYLPLILVASRGGPPAVAVYGAAALLSSAAMLLLGSSMTVLLPAASNPSIPVADYLRRVRHTVWPVVLLVCLGIVAAPLLVRGIFGDRFSEAISVTQLLLSAQLILTVANPIQFLHYRRGGERFLTLVDTVGVAVTFVLALLTLPMSDAPTAVAMASLVGTGASRLIGVVGLRR